MIRPIRWLRIIFYFILITIFIICIVLNLTGNKGKKYEDGHENSNDVAVEDAFTELEVNDKLNFAESEPTNATSPTEYEDKGSLPWYFENGSIRPKPGQVHENELWPETAYGDRIINQLMYVPAEIPKKAIKVFVSEKSAFGVKSGTNPFAQCPVNTCVVTNDKIEADAVVHRNYIRDDEERSNISPNQIWIFFTLENPYHTSSVNGMNWTATYKTDSDIVAPYAKWVYYDESVKKKRQAKNYAEGKTKKVAWFVSNCHPQNARKRYALELQQYIDVDIYGQCGELSCPKTEECWKKLEREYKFYLAFENGNCREYITEKFFLNALSRDILPIAMGAHPDDYDKAAPANSFLHVDRFTTPKHLADYLHYLDKNEKAYNSFFEWKGTGEFINTYFFCRVCSMLHAKRKHKTYKDFKSWWEAPGICTKKSWPL